MKTRTIDFYEELEKCIVEDCGKYYSVISKDWMNDSVEEYLLKVVVCCFVHSLML
jgi:hypothetical protein